VSFAKRELDNYYAYRDRINARRTGNYDFDNPKPLPKVVTLSDIVDNNKKALFNIHLVNNETRTITYYKNVYYDKNNEHFYYYFVDNTEKRRYKTINFKDVTYVDAVGLDTTKQILDIQSVKVIYPAFDYSRVDGRTNEITYTPVKSFGDFYF
jgi:hypothetical protein